MVEKVIKWGKVGLWIESDKTMEMGFRLDEFRCGTENEVEKGDRSHRQRRLE